MTALWWKWTERRFLFIAYVYYSGLKFFGVRLSSIITCVFSREQNGRKCWRLFLREVLAMLLTVQPSSLSPKERENTNSANIECMITESLGDRLGHQGQDHWCQWLIPVNTESCLCSGRILALGTFFCCVAFCVYVGLMAATKFLNVYFKILQANLVQAGGSAQMNKDQDSLVNAMGQ